jgi:hypothetical protein
MLFRRDAEITPQLRNHEYTPAEIRAEQVAILANRAYTLTPIGSEIFAEVKDGTKHGPVQDFTTRRVNVTNLLQPGQELLRVDKIPALHMDGVSYDPNEGVTGYVRARIEATEFSSDPTIWEYNDMPGHRRGMVVSFPDSTSVEDPEDFVRLPDVTGRGSGSFGYLEGTQRPLHTYTIPIPEIGNEKGAK